MNVTGKQLFNDMTLSTEGIERLLDDYGHYVSEAQAKFIRAYTYALAQDFEHAMTRGENTQLQIVVEDLRELERDTLKRLVEVKSLKKLRSDVL